MGFGFNGVFFLWEIGSHAFILEIPGDRRDSSFTAPPFYTTLILVLIY